MSNFGPKFLATITLGTATIIFGAAAPFIGAIAGGVYASSALAGGIAGLALGVVAGPVPYALTTSTLMKEGSESTASQFAKSYASFIKDYTKITALVARNIGDFFYKPFKKEAPYVAETKLTMPDTDPVLKTTDLKSEFPGNQSVTAPQPLTTKEVKDPQPKI